MAHDLTKLAEPFAYKRSYETWTRYKILTYLEPLPLQVHVTSSIGH